MSKCKDKTLKQRIAVGAVTTVVTLSSVMPSTVQAFAQDLDETQNQNQPVPDGAPDRKSVV